MNRNPFFGLALVGLLCLVTPSFGQQKPSPRYPIIPYPVSLTPGQGKFTITATTKLYVPAVFDHESVVLNRYISNGLGRMLSLAFDPGPNTIVLYYDKSITAEEGYKLSITPQQVRLSARTPAGIFMAIQTLRQLLPLDVETPAAHPRKTLTLPAVTIDDAPAYGWRGMHLDVSRHFFSIAYLKKFIDVMALYKMNRFHLHLTDDQGWRIEIKKYPKLTEYGAWRTFNNQDSACMQKAVDNPDYTIDPAHIIHKDGKTLYGGFYTQAEMKDLVAYAAARYITIIPEIDMPGHMMAAINQYPYLSCDGSSVFGKLFSTPICPCMPSTFQFAQDVYSEIMDIFPSKYLHIGGDEVDRSGWAKSAECKALMEKEGLKSVAELQSYFIRKMEQFFNAKGRKLIGWDEILEGGISPTAMVMYWRTWVPKAPIEAAKHGNAVIMTPGNPLYFDGNQDRNSLPNVYQFPVIPAGLSKEEAANIIGAQANIWTEYIPNERRADYMFMPRMTALAEVLWTNHPDYASFLQRLLDHYPRMSALHVNYRLPDLPGLLDTYVFVKQDTLALNPPLPGLTLRYTTDGSLPGSNSPQLPNPLIIDKPEQLRIAAFRPDSSRGDIYVLNYRQQSPADAATPASVADGLLCTRFPGSFRTVAEMPVTPDTTLILAACSVPKSLELPAFGLKYRGYIDIPSDGIYSFYLTCDDGGILTIAGRETVNNDGNHAPLEKSGQAALKKGLQPFALDFIEGGGGYTLKLKYSIDNSPPQDIPASWLKH